MDRLFVVLSTFPFEQFRTGKKEYEVRRYGVQFTEKTAYPGRTVELRKGYSGESLWGSIGEVLTGNLEDLILPANYRKIEPHAKSREKAIAENIDLLGPAKRYILFRVVVNR